VRAVSGARAEARELVALALSQHTRRYVSSFHLAIAYVGLEDHDCAFAALDQAWLDRDPALATVIVEPRFDSLRADRRYPELLERLNLSQPLYDTRAEPDAESREPRS
jgi:hypothetical protein